MNESKLYSRVIRSMGFRPHYTLNNLLLYVFGRKLYYVRGKNIGSRSVYEGVDGIYLTFEGVSVVDVFSVIWDGSDVYRECSSKQEFLKYYISYFRDYKLGIYG